MNQGIVHVIGPQLGLTQPGMTLACGDSHTSTHGAFGTLAFGIGTSQVRDVLSDSDLAMDKLKCADQYQWRARHGCLCKRRNPLYHSTAWCPRVVKASPTNMAERSSMG
jgi:hypothetical protein